MNRRLYFLLPDQNHALSVVNELVQSSIDLDQIHALAGPGVQVDALPVATEAQQRDVARRYEKILWNSNLVIFGAAAGVLVTILASTGPAAWILAPLTVMLGTFLFGLRLTRIPDVHLDEFRDAIAHGEILLMVDVPLEKVPDVEYRVHHHHPEAAIGGVGWSLDRAGI
jgi:hypothetical protein